MSETFMTIDDLKGFFGDVVEHPDDYPDYNLDNKSMIDLLLHKARELTDFAEYKAGLSILRFFENLVFTINF